MEQSARTHVLVVDDEEGIRDMFKDHLEERGYICHTAPSGHAALEVLGTEPVELALVDIIMPGMTGITLFEHMKDRYPDVAVIFVTAVDDLNIAVAYLRDGAYDYMVKPVGRNQFHQRVEGALAKCKAMTEGRQHRRLLEEQVARQAVELETRVRELEDLNRVFQQDLADISPNGRAESPESPSLKERQLQRSIMCLQESVKKRISEYLHGHVQSKLLVLQYKLGQCQEVVSQDPEGASTLLNEMRADLQSIQENDIRQASHELYPAIVNLGLVPALRSLRDRFRMVIPIELSVGAEIMSREERDSGSFPEEFKVGVYRIVEEALDNVVKHARADTAKIELCLQQEGWLSLTISDDGRGFSGSQGPQVFGIQTMKDYAEALGGACQIESEPGRGSSVRVTLPLPACDE